MDKLISLSEFVKTHEYPNNQEEAQSELVLIENFYNKVTRYNYFLKQELNIGMFVPAKLVNGEWVVLENPYNKVYTQEELDGNVDAWEAKEYREAKERVLFEGFKLYKEKSGLTKVFNSESNIELYLPNNNKVERLAFGKIVLTESAKQKIFNT